jgi:hypothetical protein
MKKGTLQYTPLVLTFSYRNKKLFYPPIEYGWLMRNIDQEDHGEGKIFKK